VFHFIAGAKTGMTINPQIARVARLELCLFLVEILKQLSKAQRNSCNMRVKQSSGLKWRFP
jgi:hypothetical protein